MSTKTFSKKLIAFVSAVVMSASLAAYVPSGVLQKFNLGNTDITASADGNLSVSPSTPGGSASFRGYGDIVYSNSVETGVRIYLARNTIYCNSNPSPKITAESVKELNTAKKYALYCLTSECSDLKDGTHDLADASGSPIPSTRILEAAADSTFGFSGLVDTNKRAKIWRWKSTGSSTVTLDVDLSGIQTWANDVLGKMDAEHLETFLKNYQRILGSSYAPKYPRTVEQYIGMATSDGSNASGWAIIIEPVVLLHIYGLKDRIAVSLNDYYNPSDAKQINGFTIPSNGNWASYNCPTIGQNSFAAQNPSVGSETNFICSNFIKGMLGTLYCKFNSEILPGEPLVSTEYGRNEQGYSLRGFGIFAQGKTLFGSASTLRLNKNISWKADTAVNSDPTKGTKITSLYDSNENSFGNAVVAKRFSEDEKVTPVSGSDILRSISGTAWSKDSLANSIQFYKTGSKYDGFRINTTKPQVSGNVYKSLTGFSLQNKALQETSNLIMTEMYVGSLTTNATDYKVNDLFSQISSSGYSIASCEKQMGMKDSAMYKYGSNFGAILQKSTKIGATRVGLSSAAENVAAKIRGTSNGSLNVIKAIEHTFGLYWRNNTTVEGTANVTDGIANSITYSLQNSKAKIKKGDSADTYGTSAKNGTPATVGITIQTFVPDQKVQSYYQTIHRDKNGRVTYGAVKATSAYSIYNGHDSRALACCDESTPTYYIVIPNTEANGDFALGNTYGKKSGADGRAIGNAVFGTAFSLNSASSLASIEAFTRMAIKDGGTGCAFRATFTMDMPFALGAYADKATGKYCGFSVYRLEDEYVKPNQDVEMNLASHNLNYVYPSLLGDSKGHYIRTVAPNDINTMSNVTISKTDSYGGTLINSEGGKSGIKLLWAKYPLPYGLTQTLNQRFDLEAKDIKTFTAIDKNGVTLNHAVSMSRGLFGDNYVVSSFNKANTNFASTRFYTDVLMLNVGNIGSSSPKSISAGKTGVVATGADSFIWACNRSAYILNNTHSGGNTYSAVSPYRTGESKDSAGYNISETVNRYVAVDKSTASNATSGMISTGRVKATNSAYGYRAYSVKNYDKTFKFYPEVAMSAWKYDDSTGVLNSYSDVTHGTVYVLGEKVRSLKATAMYGIAVNGAANGKNLAGATKSDTVAAGSDAKALSKKFNNLQVIYAGGNVNVAASGNFSIDLSGFALDQIDKDKDKKLVTSNGNGVYTDVVSDNSNLKKTWGSDAYDAQSEYKKWVEEVKNSLAVDMSLQVSKDINGGNVVKTYNGYKASVGKVDGGNIESTTSYALTYKNGVVVEDTAYAELIKALRQYAGVSSDAEAKALFEASGINKEILSSIESSTNGSSEKVDGFAGDHWYDETVRTFVVRYYKCAPIKMSNITVSDKIDINAGPSQSTKSKTLFSNGYVGKWYLTVYLKSANSSMPSLTLYDAKKQNYDADSVLIAKQHVEQADFVIPDATTADARK